MGEDTSVVDTTNDELDGSVSKEAYNKLVAENEKLIHKVAAKNGINKEGHEKRDELNAKIAELEATIADTKTVDLLKNEEYKTLYEDKTTAYEDLNSKHANLLGDIKANKIDAALESALKEEGVTSVSTALKLMDKSGVSLDNDGIFSGIATAIETLKKDHEIVFKPTTSAPNPVRASEESNDFVEFDVSEYDMKKPEDREKYKKYRKAQGLAN